MAGAKISLEDFGDESTSHCIPNCHKISKKMTYLTKGLADISTTRPLESESVVGFYHETIRLYVQERIMCKLGLRW